MTKDELEKYKEEIPDGYRAMGWTAKNVAGGTKVAADLSFVK